MVVPDTSQHLYQDVDCTVKEGFMSAALMMLLISLYLGSMIMLYNKEDSEYPFYIVYIFGAGLGGTLLSPNVPRWLILIISIIIVIGILKSGYLRTLLFVPQGLIIFSIGCLCLRDVRSQGHDIATAIISLIAVAMAMILALKFQNLIAWIIIAIIALIIICLAFGGELIGAVAFSFLLLVAMIFLM